MRKLLYACPLLFLWGTTVLASPLKSKPVYDFSKGCDTYHSSLSLPDGFVADSQDVFFDGKAPIEKRHGYTTAFSSGSFSYQGEWTYTDPTNTSWIIVRSSNVIIANNLSGSTSVLVATVSANNLVGETNSQGYAFFVDQTNGVYFWNGSTTTYVANSPLGSMIASFHGRLWVSGAAVPNGNQVYGSSYLNGTIWTPNVNPNDPVQLTVGLQDNFDNVTAMYVFLDTMYAFKHYSTYALTGYDQTSFAIGYITQECGCIDQASIQTFNHGLDFMSERGVEFFDGYTCTRISDPMKDKVNNAIISQGGTNSLSWVQSQSSDWNSGSFVNLDTTTFAPGIALDNKTINIPNGGFENNFSSWTASSQWAVVTSTGYSKTITAFEGTKFAVNSFFDTSSGMTCPTAASVVYSSNTSSVIATVQCPNPIAVSGPWEEAILNFPNPSSVESVSIKFFNPLTGDVLISTPFLTTGTSLTYWLSEDNDTLPPNFSYNTVVTIDSVSISGVELDISSGTFNSQVHQIGSINSWGNFAVQEQLNGGSISFDICSSSDAIMSPEVCGVQSPNSQILIPTNTFVQWNSTFTVTSATQTPTLNSATVQWFSGNRSAGMASTVWDDRYWLSLSTNTSDSFNDAILVLNTQGAWAPMNIQAGGLTQYKNSLYIADSKPTGNVYLYGQGYNDNGSPINAFIRSKDYSQDQLSSDDYYDSMYISEDDLGNYNTSIEYFMDRDLSSPYILSTLNQSEFQFNAAIKIPFLGANQDFGKCISLQFEENDLGSPWDFYGWEMFYHPRAPQ